MNDESVFKILSAIFGFGFFITIALACISMPSGVESKEKECLKDHPDICRDITTFTTKWKQVK